MRSVAAWVTAIRTWAGLSPARPLPPRAPEVLAAVIAWWRKAERQRLAPRAKWTGEGSGTALGIKHHLQFGPLTRRQLDDLLDVTTAGLLLPRMVERGEVRVIAGTRPYRYELVT